jgi:hypothetical protein
VPNTTLIAAQEPGIPNLRPAARPSHRRRKRWPQQVGRRRKKVTVAFEHLGKHYDDVRVTLDVDGDGEFFRNVREPDQPEPDDPGLTESSGCTGLRERSTGFYGAVGDTGIVEIWQVLDKLSDKFGNRFNVSPDVYKVLDLIDGLWEDPHVDQMPNTGLIEFAWDEAGYCPDLDPGPPWGVAAMLRNHFAQEGKNR